MVAALVLGIRVDPFCVMRIQNVASNTYNNDHPCCCLIQYEISQTQPHIGYQYTLLRVMDFAGAVLGGVNFWDTCTIFVIN